jgi:hypothetical protein
VLQVFVSFVFVVLPFTKAVYAACRGRTPARGPNGIIQEQRERESDMDSPGYLDSPFGFGLHRLVMESQIYFTLSIGIALAVEFCSHPFHSMYEYQVFPPVLAMTTVSACMSTFWSIVHWRSPRFKRRPLIFVAILAIAAIAINVINNGTPYYEMELDSFRYPPSEEQMSEMGISLSGGNFTVLQKPSLEIAEVRATIRVEIVQVCTKLGFLDSISDTSRGVFMVFGSDKEHVYSVLIVQAVATTGLTGILGAVPLRRNGEMRFKCVFLIFGLVLLEFGISIFTLVQVATTRQAMRELQGDRYIEDTWDFDQILAVLAWSPLCTEFVYWVLCKFLGRNKLFSKFMSIITNKALAIKTVIIGGWVPSACLKNHVAWLDS